MPLQDNTFELSRGQVMIIIRGITKKLKDSTEHNQRFIRAPLIEVFQSQYIPLQIVLNQDF